MEQVGVRARGGDARAQGVFKHIAGAAGILADDDARPVLLSVIPAQEETDAQRVHSGEVHIGLAAKSIGAEIFTHRAYSLYRWF